MSHLPLWIRKNPLLPWGLLFLALNLIVTQYGGINAMSRTAAMRAITENHTLHIDRYKDWTIDWAKSPNGHYYSNKAPGPVLLGLPIFALTELVSLPLGQKKLDTLGRAPQPGYVPHLLLMLWLQLLPCFLLVLWIGSQLLARGASPAAVHFFALAAFFGNTASFYMNSNFGHGIAAILFLAAFFAWWEARYVLTGLMLSWSLLTDYGVAFALPFFLLATVWRERSLKTLLQIGIGALPGALIWTWYHVASFGSPFATANQFTNPEQIETLKESSFHLWSSYAPFPSSRVVRELLFGTSRGLLFTQPWMLAIFVLPFLRLPNHWKKGSSLLLVGSLAGLIWMNGGFGGWHGGWSLGPRYLSVAFLAMALGISLAWEAFSPIAHRLLWALLAVALGLRLFTFPFPNLAPNENLWAWHWRLLISGDHLGTVILRYALALLLAGGAVFFWRRAVSISRDSV